MSSADLFEDGFPHGTKDGYARGCRGAACPTGLELGLSCRDANTRYHADYGFRKAVDRGATVQELAREQQLTVVKPSKKPAVAPTRGFRDSEARMEEVVFPTTQVRPSRVDASVAAKAAARPSRKGAQKPSAPSIRPADLVRRVREVEIVSETVSEARRPGRKPSPHGTDKRWRTCRKDPAACPGDETGRTCQEAHEATLRRPRTAPVGDDAAAEISGPQAGAEPSDAEEPADAAEMLGGFPLEADVSIRTFVQDLSVGERAEVERFGIHDELATISDPIRLDEVVRRSREIVEGGLHEVPLEEPIEGVAVFEGRVPSATVQQREQEAVAHWNPNGGLVDDHDLRTALRQRDEAREENARLRAELAGVRVEEVLVEGSWFKVADLPSILGNYIRAAGDYGRDAKDAYRDLLQARARVAELEGLVSGDLRGVAVQVSFEDGRLAGVRVEVPQGADR